MGAYACAYTQTKHFYNVLRDASRDFKTKNYASISMANCSEM